MPNPLQAVDAHVAGASVRLLTGGVPRPSGTTLETRQFWLECHADRVRRVATREPRGHRDLVGALLTEPISAAADAGILFFDAENYLARSDVGVIAVATIALEKGLITKGIRRTSQSESGAVTLAFDTLGGRVAAEATVDEIDGAMRVRSIRISMEPSLVIHAGCPVAVGSRRLRVDLAYSGAFYAIVDAESAGMALVPSKLADIRRFGRDICEALDGHQALVHPVDACAPTVAAVVFTGPPQSADAHLRSISITAGGGCDRSGISGAPALMAVLNAMGLMNEGTALAYEGLLAAVSRGHLQGATRVGESPAVMTEVEGIAWTTSEQTLLAHPDDPLGEGFDL